MIKIMSHKHLNESLSFTVAYKNRKTIGIYIDLYGNVEVRVPKKTHDHRVIMAVENKWSWIQNKSKELQDRCKGHKPKTYEDGEGFLYQGNIISIEVIEGDVEKDNALLEDNVLKIYLKEADGQAIKTCLRRFYYRETKDLVEKAIKKHKANFKTKPSNIRIADNKSNWGSCDSNYKLTFNWRLSMAPLDVLEYVVVHELCHMNHLNHDRSFWRLVGKVMPDYETKKTWLNNNCWKMII